MNQEEHITSMVKLDSKITMLKSSLCDYSDAYILAKGTIKVTGAGDNDGARQVHERNKGVTIKNCASFTDCISETKQYLNR